MTQLENFTLEQLGLFITLILGSLSACLLVCFKSRCDRIETPCLKLHRKPLPPDNIIVKDIENQPEPEVENNP